MAEQQDPRPFTSVAFCDKPKDPDAWPALYHGYEEKGNGRKRRVVANPNRYKKEFLASDLSVDGLDSMGKHLWLAGSKRPPAQLHFQVAMGRQIIVDERMDHHLVWDNSGRIFLRPIPRFLLDQTVWNNLLVCPAECRCGTARPPQCMQDCRKIARGFLYTYSCLVSSETDFFLANEHRLLPRGPKNEGNDMGNLADRSEGDSGRI